MASPGWQQWALSPANCCDTALQQLAEDREASRMGEPWHGQSTSVPRDAGKVGFLPAAMYFPGIASRGEEM